MTLEEMGRALDAANRKQAAAEMKAGLIRELDPDYVAIVTERRAGEVRFTDNGEIDEASLAAVVKDVLASAPAKFRNDAKAESTGPQFYDRLREAVAARHAAQNTGGVGELAKRMGN